MTRSQLLAAVALGILLRVAAIPLPGTYDIAVWKIWSYATAHLGVARVYGVGGTPTERRLISFRGAEATADYPPLGLAVLGMTARAYEWAIGGEYPDDNRLVMVLKAPIVIADALLLALLYWIVHRICGPQAARWVAVMYWLNPAVVLEGPVLGYLDTLYVLPAIASLAAGAFGFPVASGALWIVALLMKPQAVVLAPAVAVAVWYGSGSIAGGARAAAAAGATLLVCLLPFVAAGSVPNLVLAMSRFGHHDMLSGNACNLWWIIGWGLRVYYSAHDMGVVPALIAPARILAISRVVELGYPNPRTIGVVLMGLFAAWSGWLMLTSRRRRDLFAVAAFGAVLIHAYGMLAAQVHENHMYATVPLLTLAAAGRRRLVPLLWTVTLLFALNLNLFYGISEDVGYRIPRSLTVVDMTVLLSLVNLAVFVWHARMFRSECSTADELRRAPAPA